jgi:hypothetical protein
MWMVKRKLFNKEVYDHIVPYFYSPQGFGKTTLIRKFVAPFAELQIETDITKLTDRFANQILENHYIAHLEESAGAQNAPIEQVKSLITQAHTADRDMYSQTAKKRSVNVCAIISSNNPLRTMFRDYTGMRRFFQIEHGPLDFGVVNGLDYEDMWLGIDENDDTSPIRRRKDTFDKITEIQEKHRAMNLVETFLRQKKLLSAGKYQKRWYTSTDLYPDFNHWCEKFGEKGKVGFANFLTQMHYLYPKVRSRQDDEGNFSFLLADASGMDPDGVITPQRVSDDEWDDLS